MGGAMAEGADRASTLACTDDGIFVWPGTALTEKRGARFVPRPIEEVYSAVAALHGASVIPWILEGTLARATERLSDGRLRDAQEIIRRLALPPLSPDGAALARAVAARLDVAPPAVAVAGGFPSWRHGLADALARSFDGSAQAAARLEKVFNLVLHPRWPVGQSDGGRFRPTDGADEGEIEPVAGRLPSPETIARFIAMLRRVIEALAQRARQQKPPEQSPEPPEPSPPQQPQPPGIGHNQPPEPIPSDEPSIELYAAGIPAG